MDFGHPREFACYNQSEMVNNSVKEVTDDLPIAVILSLCPDSLRTSPVSCAGEFFYGISN